MTLLPSSQSPFGLLQPIHGYIVDHAQPICLANAHRVVILPLLPLGIQAYLLQYHNTQLYRVAIGAVGVLLMLDAWRGYRFVGEAYTGRC